MKTIDYLDYAAGFAGNCLPSDTEFLADCRRILKGSGFMLWTRGRGKRSAPGFSKRKLAQDLPLAMAREFALYVRPTGKLSRQFREASAADHKKNGAYAMGWQKFRQLEARAAGMIEAVRRIYGIHSKPVGGGK